MPLRPVNRLATSIFVLAACAGKTSKVSIDASPIDASPPVPDGTISCADWYRFPIAGTNNVLINNVWNKQHAGTYPYHQCLTKRSTIAGDQYGWVWDWPDFDPSTSYAAPEIVFGRKPWDGGASTSPDLPKRIDAIPHLSIDFGVEVTADPYYNLNSTMWLTQSDTAPMAADPQNITTEVMVRFDDPANIGGCCTPDGEVSLNGIPFTVWHQDGHADASGGSNYTWKMVTYVSRVSLTDAQFDLALVLGDMVAKGLAQSTYGVQGVELITEISGGKGELWLKRFSVTLGDTGADTNPRIDGSTTPDDAGLSDAGTTVGKLGAGILPDCRLPPDPGSCSSSIQRYYFDPATYLCYPFVYGGCGGNGNNFLTNGRCRQFCAGGIECSCPPESGACTTAFGCDACPIDRTASNYASGTQCSSPGLRCVDGIVCTCVPGDAGPSLWSCDVRL